MGDNRNSIRSRSFLGAMAFGAVLAVVIGVRLDQAALAAVVGVACGVGASIPTGLLVVLLLRRRDQEGEKRATRGYGARSVSQPPLVVVAPAAPAQLPGQIAWPSTYGAPGTVPSQREFAVIGEEGVEEDALDHWPVYG